MKRTRIPWLVCVVTSKDATETKAFAQNVKLDRAFADRSVLTNVEAHCVPHFLHKKPLDNSNPACQIR